MGAVACVLERSFERNREVCEQFLTDAAAIGRLHARGTLHTLDVGRLDDGRPYVVEEAIVGEAVLARREREGFLLVRHVLAIADQVLVGLEETHDHDLFHGTLTADKLVLTPDGCVKILDLGFGRTAARAGILARSEEHPEADLHALGKILHILVTGHAPTGEPVGAIASEVPAAVRAVIDRALAPRVTDRWPNASTMREALCEAYATFVRKPLGDPEETLRFHPRSPVPDTVRLPHEAIVAVTTKTSDVAIVRTLPSAPFSGSPRTPKVGAMFGRYEVEACLGRGGMGDVYRARDESLERDVAIKVVRDIAFGDEARATDAVSRLRREARAAAAIRHPNVVAIYEVGEADGCSFVAMEFVDGRTLRELIRSRALSPELAVSIMTDVARALHAAHERGIVHRDVKPENIMVTDSGVVKVLDFGIARRTTVVPNDAITSAGVVMGSPRYMSPEQLRGEEVNAATDQFSWAVTTYELLSGESPWCAASGAELVSEILRGSPRSLTPRISRLPTAVDAVVHRALSKNPAHRFASLNAVVEALGLGVGVVSSQTLGALVQNRRTRARLHPVVLATAVLATAAAVAFSMLAFTRSRASTADHPVAAQANVAGPVAVRSSGASDYAAALQLWADASPYDALRRLSDATARDPAFAPAHLRYALFDDVTPRARQHFQLASQYRSSLSSHENALLNALEPSLRDPIDLAETRSRLERLERERPDDSDLPIYIANRYLLAWNGRDALPAAERAVAASRPPRAIARLARARALAKLDRLDESREEYSKCFSSSPSATGCLRWQARLDLSEGRCATVERLARQLIAASPANPDGYYFLAGGVFGQTGSVTAAADAVGLRWPTLPKPIQSFVQREDEFHLGVMAGDFVRAGTALDAWEAEGGQFADADHRGGPAVQRLLLNLELGRLDHVALLAGGYLDKSRAWTEGEHIVFDIEAHRALRLARHISREDFAARRDGWLRDASGRRVGWQDLDLYKWYEGYVEAVVDERDAVEAISARPASVTEPDPELLGPQATQRLGRMYLLAGDRDRAFKFLRKAVGACSYNRPLHQTWAQRDLAIALLDSGDRAGACASLKVIDQRWGRTAASVTAMQARALAAKNGCLKEERKLQ